MFHIFQDGSANIHYEFAPGRAFQLVEVRLHLSAAGGANSFTTTLQSQAGPEHNIVVNTQDMTSESDELFQPTRPVPFIKNDSLLFEWTNASSLRWGLEIIVTYQ